MSGDAQESSHEPKTLPRQPDLDAGYPPPIRKTAYDQGEPKVLLPVESTFEPETLPGLGPRLPLGSSFPSPPAYIRKVRRSESPIMPSPEPTEPLDVTKSPKSMGSAGGPDNVQRQSNSKRHAAVSPEDIEWPLPSTFSDLGPKGDPHDSPNLGAGGAAKREKSKAKPPEPASPARGQGDRGQGSAGPSSPKPMTVRSQRYSPPHPGLRQRPAESPFDDNADDSASEYSVGTHEKGQWGSKLKPPEAKQINDDGISEMSVSSRRSNRNSWLNRRASDEISVVSSLDENEDRTAPPETDVMKRSLTALPEVRDD
jgi:hypothetical protein